MSRTGRHRPLLTFALSVTLALALAPPAIGPARAQGGRAAQLEELLPRLSQRAAIYQETALRFACEEVVTLTEFDNSEDIKNQDRVIHDYLLEYTRRNGLQPYRAILSENDKPTNRHEVAPDYGMPQPYAWQLMFVEGGQGRFQFRLLDREFLNPHDTWVIEFIALASYTDGNSIVQWEGKVWVDQDTLDILKIEARPSKEVATLEAWMDEYRQKFSFMGIKAGKRPKARFLKVEFDVDREDLGLRLPSRSLYSVRLARDLDDMQLKSSIVQRFQNYVFFDVESLDKFREMKP